MDHLFTQIIETLLSILLAVLTAATPMIVSKVLGWLKLSGDDKARQALESAITNGIALAQARVNQQISQGTSLTHEEATAQVIAGAKAYVMPKVPDAIKRLGVDSHLEEVIEARVAAPKPDVTIATVPTGGSSSSPPGASS